MNYIYVYVLYAWLHASHGMYGVHKWEFVFSFYHRSSGDHQALVASTSVYQANSLAQKYFTF